MMNREGIVAWKELWITGLSLLLVLGPAAVALRLLKDVPRLLQENQESAFPTIEAAESALGIKVLVPSYFPEFLEWPASEVKAFRKETLTIRIVFRLRKENSIGLIVYQIVDGREGQVPELSRTDDEENPSFVTVGRQTATLFFSRNEGHERYRLVWDLPDRRMILMAAFSKQHLLTLAGSIH